MDQGSADHLLMVLATAAVAVGVSLLARRDRGAAWILPARRAGAVVLAGGYTAFWLVDLASGRITARGDLPLDLSDIVVPVAAIALWSGHRLAFELTYFWGLTASVQALVTPSLGSDFPDHRWWWFALAHGGVVVAAIVLSWGLGFTPAPRAVWRVTAISLGVAAVVGAADVLLDANYMFLRRPPSGASLLDLFGPWPLYLVGAAALAIALFWLLDQPFRGRRRQSAAADGRRPPLGCDPWPPS